MIHKTELNAENLEIGLTQEGTPTILPKPIYYLQQNGYQIESINEVHTVHRDSSDTGHVVFKIETYEYPKNDPRLDVAAHRVQIHTCDCWSYLTDHWPDLREDNKPSQAGACVHIQEVSKVEKAKSDENQETL